MVHLEFNQSDTGLAGLRQGKQRHVQAQHRRLMVLSGFAGALAMVGVAAAVLSALL